MKKMKIVCGTNFSIHAAHAAEVAAALTQRNHATLNLVHVLAPSRLDFLSENQVGELRAKLRRKLSSEGKRLRQLGADVTERLEIGIPHEVLVRTARHSKADLIVASTVGHVAPTRWLTGSVAERTAQNSTVPTLVVRKHKRLVDWAKGGQPLNVFVGYDFSPSSDAALAWVSSLQNIGPLNITVTYLARPVEQAWRLGMGVARSGGDIPPEVLVILERDLKERCSVLLGDAKVQLNVASAWGAADIHLLDHARAIEPDLIVVGTNQRRGLNRFWLGSVSRGILHHASTNVAVVPMRDTAGAQPDGLPVFNRVLVPTDFSKLGDRAVAFAYGAAQRGGEVCLVHVIPPVLGFKSGISRPGKRRVERKNQLAARLQALVPEDAHARGIQSRVEVVEHQHPSVAICQAAERADAKLICIGSRGRSGIKRRILGSVTEAVMQRSRRPVLVVRA